MARKTADLATIALILTAALALVGVAQAEQLAIRIVYPTESTPVFGDIEVVIEVGADEPVEFVRLTVDGETVGKRTSPPFTFSVSLGDDNRSHQFEVEAVGVEGTRSTASLASPAIQVDDLVELALQQAYVTVTDSKRKRVRGLSPEDFQIYDDGVAQSIVTFAGGEIPFSAILLIDGSHSMMGAQIAAARSGARAFLSGMNELDEAKVIIFSTRLLATSDFAGREEPLGHLVESVIPDGGTAINDYLFLGLQRLEQRHGRRVLVLLSDGLDVHSVLQMEQVAGVARQSQSQIYWLRLEDKAQDGGEFLFSWRDPPASRRQARLLEKVIRESGGRILKVTQPGEIEAAFQEVLRELREQYALGYYPKQRHSDGRWRELRIRVRGGLDVKAKEGYLDLP